MKVRLSMTTLLLTAAVSLGAVAQAQYVGPTAAPALSVKEILKNPVDDQDVRLQGYLLRQLSAKTYMFSDGTAEIVAEIKPKRFKDLPEINEKTQVEIVGEVDTSRYRAPEIEVESIRIYSPSAATN